MVAATNKNLRQEVRGGRFREDLFYSLNVIPIHLPPLRDRRGDIPLLVDHFLEKYNRENNKNVTKLSRGVLDLLLGYPWPGNVRELENCIERAVVMSPGDVLSVNVLPDEIVSYRQKSISQTAKRPSCDEAEIRRVTERFCETTDDLAAARRKLSDIMEETIIRKALSHKISQRELAERLGISRMTLRKKIRKFGLKS
jgi:DNA-binding NtrC family response regulator